MREGKVIARFAPASASVLSVSPEVPEVKSGGGSLRLSRWLPQPAARAAAFCDDAGGDRGVAQGSGGTPWQSVC